MRVVSRPKFYTPECPDIFLGRRAWPLKLSWASLYREKIRDVPRALASAFAYPLNWPAIPSSSQ